MEDEKNLTEWMVTTYQSGTTWLQTKDGKLKFHVGHWDGKPPHPEFVNKRRLQDERVRFTHQLMALLNEHAKWLASGGGPMPYFCRLMTFYAKIEQTRITFLDSHYGTIQLNRITIGYGGSWTATLIPESFKDTLKFLLKEVEEHSHED